MKIEIEIGKNMLIAVRYLLEDVEKWNKRVLDSSDLLFPGKEIQRAFGINIKETVMGVGKREKKDIRILKEIEELDFEEKADGEDEEAEKRHEGRKRKE